MIIDNIDEMSASAFRSAYGVPVISLGETRETLATEREALREVYGDHWREEQEQWLDDTNDDDQEQEEPITRMDAKGYGWRITLELVDGLED